MKKDLSTENETVNLEHLQKRINDLKANIKESLGDKSYSQAVNRTEDINEATNEVEIYKFIIMYQYNY